MKTCNCGNAKWIHKINNSVCMFCGVALPYRLDRVEDANYIDCETNIKNHEAGLALIRKGLKNYGK